MTFMYSDSASCIVPRSKMTAEIVSRAWRWMLTCNREVICFCIAKGLEET
jgi:hypothetical protein